MANIDSFIEEFNDSGFDGRIQKVFINLINFLRIVAKNNKQGEIDISIIDYDDFKNNQNLFDFLDKNGFVEERTYEEFDDSAKNYFLDYWINKNPNEALKYICDHLLTDVEMRSDGFWLRLRDREELADFFDNSGRDTTAKDLAKAILSEDDSWFGRWWDTTDDVYNDVIGELDDANKKHLADYILKHIGNQDLNVEDYGADFFHELAEIQARDGFFQITQDDVMSLIDDREAMNELLDGDLDELKSELNSIHNNAYNSAYENECYSLVYNGLDQYFSSKIMEETKQVGEKTRFIPYIKIRFFKTDVLKFIEENAGGGYNDSNLEYWGSYTGMMGSLFESGFYEAIDFRIPDYPSWSLIKKNINEFFGDYI